MRSRIRSPITGCSAMTAHSASVSGPPLCRISFGIASLPTSCSSAAVGDPLDRRRRRGRASSRRRVARRDDLRPSARRVVVARLDRGGERLDGGGRAGSAPCSRRQLALDVRVGDRDAALAGALGQQQRAVGVREQRVGVQRRAATRRRRSSSRRPRRRAVGAPRDGVADALGDRARGRLVGAGQQRGRTRRRRSARPGRTGAARRAARPRRAAAARRRPGGRARR